MPLPKTFKTDDGAEIAYAADQFERDPSRLNTYIHKPTGIPFKLGKEDRKALKLAEPQPAE